MSAATHAIKRTSILSLYAKHVPTLGIWAAGLTTFFFWPYASSKVSNKVHHVPARS
ncbi:hypothetical protein CAAN1_08S05556 [[Candida] anglica]|uniref:Uncharacterized protein n=1 Tax=[Candida] anglica TaxID=148631 RepID=A0ABP0E8S9_9ASCO